MEIAEVINLEGRNGAWLYNSTPEKEAGVDYV
jgi:hypothetical protein